METVHTFHYKEGFHAVRATGATVETSKRRGRVSMGLGGAGGAARQVEGGTEGRWGVIAQRTQYRPPPLQRVHATCWHCAPSSASPKGAALLPHLRLARPQSRPHTPNNPRPTNPYPHTPPSTQGLHHLVALHHYITKSLADFELKMRRRGGAGSIRTLDDYTKWVDRCNSTCAQAVPLGQELGARFDLARGVPASCAAGGQPLLGEGAGAADTARRR